MALALQAHSVPGAWHGILPSGFTRCLTLPSFQQSEEKRRWPRIGTLVCLFLPVYHVEESLLLWNEIQDLDLCVIIVICL